MSTIVVRSPLLTRHGFAHGFSLRHGGVSRAPFDTLNLGRAVGDEPASVAENHERMARAVGYEPGTLFEVSQVHGRHVRVVAPSEDPKVVRREEGDALVANAMGTAIGVRAADCIAVLFADPQTRAVAAVHAGWRGTVAGVALSGLERLVDVSNAPRSRVVAAVFPHIRACCFEVGDDVAQTIASRSPAQGIVSRVANKAHVDLAAVVRAQLREAGVDAAHIDDVAGCTRCEPARFFSYRRDGQVSGRHLAAIVAG
jgi:YfiH family protein